MRLKKQRNYDDADFFPGRRRLQPRKEALPNKRMEDGLQVFPSILSGSAENRIGKPRASNGTVWRQD